MLWNRSKLWQRFCQWNTRITTISCFSPCRTTGKTRENYIAFKISQICNKNRSSIENKAQNYLYVRSSALVWYPGPVHWVVRHWLVGVKLFWKLLELEFLINNIRNMWWKCFGKNNGRPKNNRSIGCSLGYPSQSRQLL